MRRSPAALLLCLLALSACGREEGEPTPAACRAGQAAVLRALEAAPDRVAVDGTPLSACLEDTTDGGTLQEIGAAYVDAAAALAARAADDREGEAALQLGYLVGAVKRSEAGAQGVGYELGRRIGAEAARVRGGSRAFARGRRAGAAGG